MLAKAHNSLGGSSHSDPNGMTYVLAGVVGVVFLVAAVTKADSPDDVIKVVAWLLPADIVTPLIVRALSAAIVAWEMLLGTCLLLGFRDKIVTTPVVLTLLGFSIVLLFLFRPDAPRCGCFGLPQAVNQYLGDPAVGLVRNAGLMWISGWLWIKGAKP
jgi:uncharacterized membrane protein YphA (DoxX/SURF4 family)